MRFGRKHRGRQHDAHDLGAASGEIGDDAFEVVELAEHRDAADRLSAISPRRREDSDRSNLFFRAALDCPQQHFGACRIAEQQRRQCAAGLGARERARVAEVTVGDARSRQEEHLQEPIEHDRDLAEEERAVDVGRQQHIIEHQQRNGLYARGA